MANSNKKPRPEMPIENLGLKMGSKDMAMWKNTINQLKAMIENSEEQLKINKSFLNRAEMELQTETDTWELENKKCT